MFKPLPQETTGFITEAASRIATTLRIDAALYVELADVLLTSADWTYLHIKSGGKVEVVKVTKLLGLSRICVERAKEGTKREAILVGTVVYYARTLSSIYDEVDAVVNPITLTATGEATVNPFYSPKIELNTDAKLEITGYTLNDGNYDPCKPYVCPGYQFGPFYFTSKLYPYELIETILGGVAKEVKWRISPGATEAVTGGVARMHFGQLREILQEYHGWTGGTGTEGDPDGDSAGPGEWVVGGVAHPGNGTLRQILRAYTFWPAEAVFGGVARPGNGTIRQILIQYDNWQTTTNGMFGERLRGGVAKAVSGHFA